MIELLIADNGQELLRRQLPAGSYRLGRADDNDIQLASHHVSRHHLQLDVAADRLTLTDLGSTNGVQLNGVDLIARQPTPVLPGDRVGIGPLALQFLQAPAVADRPPPPENRGAAPVTPGAPPARPPAALPGAGQLVPTLICPQAHPPQLTLAAGPVTIGHGSHNQMRLVGAQVALQHVLVRRHGRQVKVTNLDADHPATLAGQPLPAGQAQEWSPGQPLQIGATFVSLALTSPLVSGVGRRARRSFWRWLAPAGFVGGLTILCLAAVLFLGARGEPDCTGLDLACRVAALTGGESDDGGTAGPTGIATPTLAPVIPILPGTRVQPTIEFAEPTEVPTPEPTVCTPVVASNGWLDLPFPYRGTEPVFGGSAEDFRRLSQRSRFGGRINSFFDHEFPVYPPAFGGWETPDKAVDMVIFDGSRLPDAFVQHVERGEYYSGHSGIDYSPAVPRVASTPILAPYEGRIGLVIVYGDGNHAVWLEHDPDGSGRFEYATLYFHLAEDEVWADMVRRFESKQDLEVKAGDRIGTMGTTGRSTGVHLHFEVRRDINNDNLYSSFEKVDPYGFFPSEAVPTDPWQEAVTWTDTFGVERRHPGVISEYLWRHPLVEIEGEVEDCVEGVAVQVDIYGIRGWNVVDTGFTFIARDAAGNVVRRADTAATRRLTILPQELVDIDLQRLTLEWLNPDINSWETISGPERLERSFDGTRYTYTAVVQRTGRYVVVAPQIVDLVPPITSIVVSGSAISGQDNAYRGAVTVRLDAVDEGFPTPSGLDKIEYSLDCGQNWIEYDGVPFRITPDMTGRCGEGGDDEQGIRLNPDDILILALASDKAGNFEQPYQQLFLTVQEP